MSQAGQFSHERSAMSQTIAVCPLGAKVGHSAGQKAASLNAARSNEARSKHARQYGTARDAGLFFCLMQLARHFDKPLSATELMALVGSRDQALDVGEFAAAAHRLGLAVATDRLTAQALRSNHLPMIVLHSGTSNAILILSRQGDGLRVLDPLSKSTRTLGIAEVKAIGDRIL